MQKFLISIIFSIVWISTPMQLKAAEDDSAYNRLYHKFIRLYNAKDSQEVFYETAEELSTYYRKQDNPMAYYKTQLNICFYDIGCNKSLEALKRANNMLEEMKEEDFDAYSHVYLALGTIFENRGNYRMARYYYEQCLNTLNSEDQDNFINVYLRTAYLLMFLNPTEAEYWNKKARQTFEAASKNPDYKTNVGSSNFQQISCFVEGMINFAVNNKHGFFKSYEEYINISKKYNNLDNYGLETLNIAKLAFEGKYEKALEMLPKQTNNELNDIDYYDMRILIYKMMNQYDKALNWSQKKSEYIDSINSDMLFNNMNEMNAQIGVAQAQSMTNKTRETLFLVILIAGLLIISLLILYIIRNRRQRKILRQKNQQLAAALAMAEEGEKMKTEFVRSVSHEIRTPLNAINGFNDVLNTPGITLTEGERNDLLQRIKENIKAITDIVDELLRMADKESNEFYPKRDKILCNQTFSSLLYQYRDRVSPTIELKYTTKLLNRFEIETNEEGVKKIIEQLILNAVKFTKSGSIIVNSQMTTDKKMIEVSVTDTGKGIAIDQQDNIFKGFYKEDTFQQGIGLGLTVSKKIAKKLGGDLVLDKDYHEGARFVLTLPIK